MTEIISPPSKKCAYCHQLKPLSEFRRRTGKRSKGASRRGACRACRKLREAAAASAAAVPGPAVHPSAAPPLPERPAGPGPAKPGKALAAISGAAGAAPARTAAGQPRPPGRGSPAASGAKPSKGKARSRSAAGTGRSLPPSRGPKPDPLDASALVPSAKGMILMRGHSDKGRRWHQEIDLELAVTLVKEHAAVVVNRRTIRRLFSNKDFRAYILNRDNYTCYFCGLYGDTIDHLLPRAKGGHTTPDNCVCACNLCNQTKADQSLEQFLGR